VMWDALLYVPTVAALALISLKLWYGPNQSWSYLLVFLASFFAIAGINRILSRMMLLPSSPTAIDVDKQGVHLRLRNNERINLVKDLRYFPDFAGKSFGLTGMDLAGQRRQFVFHRGQFAAVAVFEDIRSRLNVYR